jgi:hypothetical protein
MYFEKVVDNERWAVAYDKARRDDGSLLFPKKLSDDFLKRQRKIQGSYIFAHQYQNEIIPGDDQDFKKEWLVYYDDLPKIKNTFAMVDPAISLDQAACYTALTIIDVDVNNMWYLKVAKRLKITATQTVKLIFDVQDLYGCTLIGIETVAYQQALMHFIQDEMRKRKRTIPIHGVNRGPEKSKNMRIRSLVPRFEWAGIQVKRGLTDFEDEYNKFPRGSYVDILDALSSIEEFSFPPEPEKKFSKQPAPNHPDYERWFIQNQLAKGKNDGEG